VIAPLGNTTSSAANKDGKSSIQKRTKPASLFITVFILAGNLIAIDL